MPASAPAAASPPDPPLSLDAQIRALLAPYLAEDYVTGIVASEFVDMMWQDNPKLFSAWLKHRATETVRLFIGAGRRADRRKTHLAGVFDGLEDTDEDAAAAAAEELSIFVIETYEIDSKKTFRHLGQMTKADCKFVADGYEAREDENRMLKAFWRTIENHMSEGEKVTEHFTEEEFIAIRNSFR